MFLEFYFAYMVLFPGLKSKKVFCRGPVCEQWVHQNGHINSYSGSNLRWLLWIMYHHVLHDSKRSAQVWCRIQGFALVFITSVTLKRPYKPLFRLKPAPSAWIMYHHVIHDFKRPEQVWCKIQGFARVFITTVTPKRPYQLFFRLKPAPSASNHVSPCNTWFQVLGASLMQNPRFRKGLHHNVPVTLNICTGQAVQNNTTTTGAKCS